MYANCVSIRVALPRFICTGENIHTFPLLACCSHKIPNLIHERSEVCIHKYTWHSQPSLSVVAISQSRLPKGHKKQQNRPVHRWEPRNNRGHNFPILGNNFIFPGIMEFFHSLHKWNKIIMTMINPNHSCVLRHSLHRKTMNWSKNDFIAFIIRSASFRNLTSSSKAVRFTVRH